MLRSNAMTIGQLARRTGVPIKRLREYEGMGFLYTLGRSESNYRLFGEEALWCVRMVQSLRSLGLTLKEIHELVARYVDPPAESIDSLLDEPLERALARIVARIATLQALRQHILEFQAARAGAHTRRSVAELTQLLAADPRRCIVTTAS